NNSIGGHEKIIRLQYIHNHPPPLLSKVSVGIQNNFNYLLENASNEYENIILTKILSGNMLKAVFEKKFFSEIHSSLNNLDHLRYLINKFQRKKYLHDQDILGLTYNMWQENNKFS
ncbi:9127_t:CDS:2, partial [Racocetra persica]